MRMGAHGKYVIALVTLLLLTGCSTAIKSSNTLKTIGATDVKEIRVETAEIPLHHRVVALANGSAEIISAMGMQSILVGRDIASTMPSLESIPIVTSGHQLIPEKIIELKSDLVIYDASTGPSNALDVLRSSNIAMQEIPQAWTFSDIKKKIESIGAAIGAPKTAQALNAEITRAMSQAKLPTKLSPRIAFLYLRGTSSIYLMGGPGSGADSLIAAIGAIDVGAQSLPNPFNSLTSEALVTTQPDVILVMTKGLESVGGMDGLLALPGVAQTPAGKQRRVIEVDDSLLLSFGPRTPALVAALSRDLAELMNS